MNKKPHLDLTEDEISSLTSVIANGELSAKVFRRVTALLELSRGKSLTEVSQTLNIARQTIGIWRDNYQATKLDSLFDKPRSGRPARISGKQRARVTALACSAPPEGHARWSLRLLADKAVELGYVESISHNAVGEILKKTLSSRISGKLGALAK
jgi:putative transposase